MEGSSWKVGRSECSSWVLVDPSSQHGLLDIVALSWLRCQSTR